MTASISQNEVCPDCGIVLPQVTEGSVALHPYIGASPGCWQLFSYLLNAGEPPVAPGELNPLLLDAYCVQHHGTPSPQAINSVAVHALALYGIFVADVSPNNALWIRQRALRTNPHRGKHERFYWLESPKANQVITIADIADQKTPVARREQLQVYVRSIWKAWFDQHSTTLAQWYKQYVE